MHEGIESCCTPDFIDWVLVNFFQELQRVIVTAQRREAQDGGGGGQDGAKLFHHRHDPDQNRNAADLGCRDICEVKPISRWITNNVRSKKVSMHQKGIAVEEEFCCKHLLRADPAPLCFKTRGGGGLGGSRIQGPGRPAPPRGSKITFLCIKKGLQLKKNSAAKESTR